MREFYVYTSKLILSSKVLTGIIRLYSKAITWIVAAIYVGFLIYSGFTDTRLLYKSIMVPAVGYIVVSIFRRLVNFKRPYEIYDYTPVLKKRSPGKSFPSRHVFSIFILAVTFFQFNFVAGITTLFFGVMLALARVFGGVHFPRDVIAGAAMGILSGVIGYGAFALILH